MDTFNFESYIANYPDLQKAGINNQQSAWNHFVRYGKSENRTDKNYNLKLTIITPCSRPENLNLLKKSIDFDKVIEWIIVYDSTSFDKIMDNPKITECCCFDEKSKYGNAQRNFALNNLKYQESYIYFLDDDNLMHPDLFKINFLPNQIYSFNQENGLSGRLLRPGFIDSAMVLIYFPLIKNIRWKLDKYEADGIFIQEIFQRNKHTHLFINSELCYYNKLTGYKFLGYSDLKKSTNKFRIFKTSKFTRSNLPQQIKNALEITKKLNPGYDLYYFDDTEMEQFLLEYNERIYRAFKKLIPGAFKADLFRYCILHRYGGCYSDIGHTPEVPFEELLKETDIVLVKEIRDFGIHNGLIIIPPEHKFMEKAIETCLYNIENEIYGISDISITGPKMLGTILENFDLKVNMLNHVIVAQKRYIKDSSNNTIVIPKFENYDSIMYPEGNDYHVLWNNHKVFNESIHFDDLIEVL